MVLAVRHYHMTLCGNAVCCHADLCTASLFGCEHTLFDCDCLRVGRFVFDSLACAYDVHCQILAVACIHQIVLLFKCHFGFFYAHPALCCHTVCLCCHQRAARLYGSDFAFCIDFGNLIIAALPYCLFVCAIHYSLDRDGVSLPLGIKRILALAEGN